MQIKKQRESHKERLSFFANRGRDEGKGMDAQWLENMPIRYLNFANK